MHCIGVGSAKHGASIDRIACIAAVVIYMQVTFFILTMVGNNSLMWFTLEHFNMFCAYQDL